MASPFISYSRYEVTFAENLARELEKRGLEPWMDFRNLVPGQPWQDQLDAAVKNCAAMIIVVSQESMKSNAVRDEWTKALAAKGRIVLVIFEACVLPDELAHCEWIEFRRHFGAAVDDLVGLLKRDPQPVTTFAPQQGRILPPTPRLVTFMATLVALNAFPGLLVAIAGFISMVISRDPTDTLLDFVGSLVILAVPIWLAIRLARLPGEIRRRKHSFGEAQTVLFASLLLNPLWAALIVFVIGAVVIGIASNYSGDHSQLLKVLGVFSVVSLLLSVALIVMTWWLLRQNEGMYRWAGPAAMRIFNRSQLTRKNVVIPVTFRPMNVTLEYDPVDEVIKDELERHLVGQGHKVTPINVSTDGKAVLPADAGDNAVKLALISRHNPSYETGQGTQLVIPVIIETADIPRTLSRLQWIDLRRGLPSRFAQRFAQLLPEPIQLIRAVGVIPSKQVNVMPFQVSAVINLLRILLTFKVVWVASVVILWLTGVQLKAMGVFIAADLAFVFMGWHTLRGLKNRSLTHRRYIGYALCIFVLSWTLQLFGGGLIARPTNIFMDLSPTDAALPISSAALLGSIGSLIVQMLPLVILILAVTPNSRRWLRKRPLLKVKLQEKVPATVSTT